MNSRYFAFTFRNQSRMKYIKPLISTLLLIGWAFGAFAQNAIGEWKDYLNYTRSIDVVVLHQRVFVTNNNAVFVYNTQDNSLERLNKITGLSGVGIFSLSADTDQNLVIVGYEDGNMDILENGEISNFAEIKNSTIVGDKAIRQITFNGNAAYISTGVGILEFDLTKREVSDTYGIAPEGNLSINETAILNDTLYAATEEGLYKGSINDDLTIFSNWHLDISTPSPFIEVRNCAAHEGKLFINIPAASVPGLYLRNPDYSWQNVNNTPYIFSLESSPAGVVYSESYVAGMKSLDGINDAIKIYNYGSLDVTIRGITSDASGTLWLADTEYGLVRYNSADDYEFIAPDGPATNKSFDIDFYDDQLWITSGQPNRPGNWNNSFKIDGFYGFLNDNWYNLTIPNYPILLDKLFFDSPKIYIDRLDPTRVFAGSMFSGFLEIKNAEITKFYDDSNTSLGERPGYPRDDGELYIGVAGFVRDQKKNLWVTNPYADKPLSVETESGVWKSFSLLGQNGLGTNKLLTDIVIDDLNQKWAIVNRGGVIVFDEGESIIDESDDKLRLMTAETGSGGLPSNEVLCISKDLDGEMWVGTTDGIGVFYAPFDALTSNFSDARRILIQQNGVYQYLLEGQSVSSIAIDGANRKWIGTFSAGVFLLSQDGTEEIQRFTAENSPLLSNVVNDIAINPETGEVFFATEDGVVSYISDATEGESANNCTTVYPNPVRENYTGPIAITGLSRDSEVRITDTRGNMIFSTISNGGKAIWDGKNTDGQRVATGVYFALSANKDGSSSCVSKILVIK